MPQGIILSSGSIGAKQEDVEKVFAANGLEVDKPEATTEVIEEPNRDAFETEEEFEAAHVEWQDKQEKVEAKDEEEEEGEEEEKPKKTSRTQRKIERATRELKTQNDDLRKRLEALEGKKPEVKAEPENKRPARADFAAGDAGQEQYEDALVKWGAEKTLTEKKAKETADEESDRLKENVTSYLAQVELAKEKYEDWDDVVNQDIPMHKGVQLAVMEDRENAAEVIYYLGKHPAYTKKLAEMTPLSAVMEVGRLSTRLKTGAPKTGAANGGEKQKTKPKVPPPVRPVNTAATSSTLTSRDAAVKKDFKAFEAAQRAGR